MVTEQHQDHMLYVYVTVDKISKDIVVSDCSEKLVHHVPNLSLHQNILYSQCNVIFYLIELQYVKNVNCFAHTHGCFQLFGIDWTSARAHSRQG